MLVISTKKAILILLVVLLCISVVANGWMIYLIYQSVNTFQSQKNNNSVLSFTSMFVEKVLMADKEIDFDTRLELETTVRSLNNQQIFDQWQAFTKAETKEDASQQAKQLLNLLVRNIKSQK
jgi:hypothetical protein